MRPSREARPAKVNSEAENDFEYAAHGEPDGLKGLLECLGSSRQEG